MPDYHWWLLYRLGNAGVSVIRNSSLSQLRKDRKALPEERCLYLRAILKVWACLRRVFVSPSGSKPCLISARGQRCWRSPWLSLEALPAPGDLGIVQQEPALFAKPPRFLSGGTSSVSYLTARCTWMLTDHTEAGGLLRCQASHSSVTEASWGTRRMSPCNKALLTCLKEGGS